MQQDIFDWAKNIKLGKNSCFIPEAIRRGAEKGSISHWVLDEGFEWGFALLEDWMNDIINDAAQLGNKSLVQYLKGRKNYLLAKEREMIMKNQLLSWIVGAINIQDD